MWHGVLPNNTVFISVRSVPYKMAGTECKYAVLGHRSMRVLIGCISCS